MNNIFKYRQLILTLAITDFKLRYKNSMLGFFWSLLEPFFMLVVLYIVFSNLMRIEIEHFQLFLLLGIIMWGFLEKGTTMGINSIVANPNFVKNVYIPRDILVLSACITALIMTLFEFIVFIAFMIIFQVIPGYYSLIVPYILIVEFFIVFGISLGLSAINVSYRDVQYIWRVIMQAGFFGTPILYNLSIFPPHIAKYMNLNPMARIIDTMRNVVIYDSYPKLADIVYITSIALIFTIVGYKIFRKYEPMFAENI